ncbi:uncharacterized protein LOC113493096 isoform X1 [Trichoplusia ni]|uniref:Uncharacterized protein LOC113493096 isoform X1 n=1 Tax=Trichoplusia ni TaxID=7111 RepID=A0A7E5VEN4_TRINI|nr:uncharacterized protein LOC113493096 isoform X1 [Trichoplusia ni]
MVLLGTIQLTNTYSVSRGPVTRGLKIEAFNKLTNQTIFFNCKACQNRRMASIPPSAFSAGRIRDTQRDMKVSNKTKGNESSKFFNTTFMELSPLKYNSKLMNSIWGLYNRYSPHNVKKINDAHTSGSELQQSAANSSNKNESMITLPSAKLDNVWAAMNVSQSH